MATKKRKKPTMTLETVRSLLDEHDNRLDYHVDWLAELTEDIKKLKEATQPKPKPAKDPYFKVSSADNYLYYIEVISTGSSIATFASRLIADGVCALLNKHGL